MKRFRYEGIEPNDEEKSYFMSLALKEAEKALTIGEIPVGAILVRRGAIVATAHNERESQKNALYHAEILAIHRACEALGGWRLWDCDLYVNLEPCIMCAGAISNARIRKVYFGAEDSKAGAFGGKFNVNDLGLLHRPKIESGLLSNESNFLLTRFFEEIRNK